MTTGQKGFSLKHKHAGLSPEDVRPVKDPLRPRIPATRGGSKKKKGVAAGRARAVKSSKDTK